ncbi:hypothetical protein BACT_0699 [Bifidobacterium actinocoloniiforme DSM 22766]|uniref:Uncharacterized protein n=1 Tax=Bifidobacterium actinocoloniiforme DSM 22766 TaxID=1437605 RepID=A0A086Z0E8_9BIFI|nr:hypothetical protein BACT_0699 [Bifidobacterium actinocoloniiforme DSM 22766]
MTSAYSGSAQAGRTKPSLWKRFMRGRSLTYTVLAVVGLAWIFAVIWMALGSIKG